MVELKVLNLKDGKAVGKLEGRDEIFKAPLRKDILNDYVIMQRRKKRQGTHATKTRSTVSGTGKKPFKQKGTGNARQGSLRGPHQYHGAVSFGPQPRKYSAGMNRQTKKLAIRSALSQKNFEGKLSVCNVFEIKSGKTKEAMTALAALSARSILVVGTFDVMTERSVRNLAHSKLLAPQALNVLDILRHDHLVLTKTALDWCNENLATASDKEAA